MAIRPDIVVIVTDQERAAPPYEDDDLRSWRAEQLPERRWFADNGVRFERHYTGATACVPSRPTLLTGQYPDLHGVTQTNGLGKTEHDSRMRWLRPGEVPTVGSWFRAAGYDTPYIGKWHVSHADLIDRRTGAPLRTNDSRGVIDPEAVQAYLDADVLDPFGFSGWVGPEPHGSGMANSGFVRDAIYADRAAAWLEDRAARRAAGDPDALRPFLLVCCFVNPHDIVLWPGFVRSGGAPRSPGIVDPPPVPPPPTAHEDLASKPAAQVAYRAAYATGYGMAPLVERAYGLNRGADYRAAYYLMHAENDAAIGRVRAAAVALRSPMVLVRTADHGDLLGAHGGLHQKWFNLYDECTRVPFELVDLRSGDGPPNPGATVHAMPTSHVDLLPTLLGAAGIDVPKAEGVLRQTHSEVHPLPGRDLGSVLADTDEADPDRAVYFMSRDNILEGDTGVPVGLRVRGRPTVPPPMQIRVPAHVGSSFEAVVARARGSLWKLVRTYDDPGTWTEPGEAHLAATGPAGEMLRRAPVPDQWELYDLDADPVEAVNRWDDPAVHDEQVALLSRLLAERERCHPARHTPWPYASRRPHPNIGPGPRRPPRPAARLRTLLQRAGLHPDDADAVPLDRRGRRALIVTTSHAVLAVGKSTGVWASELTAPYYTFVDACMDVDVASIEGGVIPVEERSLRSVVRSDHDDRFLGDPHLMHLVEHSARIDDLDFTDYDVVFLAGGWGAAFDLGTSEVLGAKITEANAAGAVIGGVCHGPLGLLRAVDTDGSPLVAGRRISAVTDKQVSELGIGSTPQHPETELRRLGARFECEHRARDVLANHWVVDGRLVTGQNQNAGPMVAREMMQLLPEPVPA